MSSDETPPPWSTDELAQLRAMFMAKATDKEIADALGDRSARAVAVKRHTLGLVFYQRATRPAKNDSGWSARARHLEATLDLVLALADSRSEHGEIADTVRDALRRSPTP